jgi:hypothetical protein
MPLRLRGFADFANYQLPEIGLCIAAALMVLFIGTGRRGVAEPATAKAYS